MKGTIIAMGFVAVALVTGCKTHRNVAVDEEKQLLLSPVAHTGRGHIIGSEERIAGKAVNHMPKGVVYRMSGDYAGNVPITLAANGEVQSYPAPTDLSAGSTPIALVDGWWLDRRGVWSNTVFTRYTYAEYAAMPAAPTPSQLLDAVIPGAMVTALMQLPMTTQEAVADTAAVNRWIEIRSEK